MKMKCSLATAMAMLVGLCLPLRAAEIVSYNLAGQPGTQVSNTPAFADSNVSGLSLTRSAGLAFTTSGNNSMNSSAWAIGEYYSFGFTVNAGFEADLTNLQIGTRSSGSGPKFLVLYSSVDGFTTPLATIDHAPGGNFVNSDINLSSLTGLTGNVEFRLRVDQNVRASDGVGTISTSGTNRVTNFFAPSGDPPANTDTGGFRINGTVSPLVSAPQFVNARPYHGAFPGVVGYDANRVDTGVSLIQRNAAPQQAQLSNIISSQQGINGVVLDFDNLAALGDIALEYKMSPPNLFTQAVADWTDVPPAPTPTLLADAGQAGSDRVLLTWPNFTIENRYLCIKVIYNGNTIAELYLGHLKGEMDGQGSPSAFIVRTQDIAAVRNELLQSKDASGRTDVDKNGIVRTQDIAQTRLNLTQGLTRVSIPANLPPES